MWTYLLLTGAVFYLVAFVLNVPAVGPLSSPLVKTLLFVALHMLTHKMLKSHK